MSFIFELQDFFIFPLDVSQPKNILVLKEVSKIRTFYLVKIAKIIRELAEG